MSQLKHDLEVWNEWIKDNMDDISINRHFSLNYYNHLWFPFRNISRILLHLETVIGNLHCENNSLKSLEGAPKYVGCYFWCDNNPNLKPIEVDNYRKSIARK